MPQVSDKFGPINVSTTLDGSGTGTVSFQAQGANIRITNLFVTVSSTTNQAVCKMYKGQVATANLISTTNSGSTGAAAHGSIDLFDGETVYVQWTGGDSGATANATFIGVKIPFGEVPTSAELTWDDPIAAGDGSLIYPALKSPNYVTGVSGWKIDRNGNAEFASATIRGILETDGANNSYVKVTTTVNNPNFGSAIIYFRPPDIPLINTTEISPGDIQVASDNSLGTNGSYLQTAVDAASWSIGSSAADIRYPRIVMRTAQHIGLPSKPSFMVTTGNANDPTTFSITLDGNVDITGSYVGKFITGNGQNSDSALIGNTETVVLTLPSATFKANRAYKLELIGMVKASVAGNNPVLRFRKTNATGTQIDAWRIYCNNVSAGYDAHYTTYMWIGGSDVTASMVVTLIGSAGFNASMNGGANAPWAANIWDAGDGANVSAWATQLT